MWKLFSIRQSRLCFNLLGGWKLQVRKGTEAQAAQLCKCTTSWFIGVILEESEQHSWFENQLVHYVTSHFFPIAGGSYVEAVLLFSETLGGFHVILFHIITSLRLRHSSWVNASCFWWHQNMAEVMLLLI